MNRKLTNIDRFNALLDQGDFARAEKMIDHELAKSVRGKARKKLAKARRAATDAAAAQQRMSCEEEAAYAAQHRDALRRALPRLSQQRRKPPTPAQRLKARFAAHSAR